MKSIFIVLFSLILVRGNCQDVPQRDYDLNKLADDIFSFQDENLNYEDIYENLIQRLASPLDLNSASAEQLRSLLILTENQVQELLDYRAQTPFISVYELQALPTFDIAVINRLLPLVQVNSKATEGGLLKRIITEKNNYVLLRHERTIETKQGYLEEDSTRRYRGTADKIYARFRVSKGNDFSFGLTAKQDAGEPFAWKPDQRGFDFYSAHFQVLNKGIVKNLNLGDYQFQFGQGLALGGGFSLGKSSDPVTTMRKSNLGIMPYTSQNENGYFRGAALQLAPAKKIHTHLFASRLLRDGSLEGDSVSGPVLSSFLLSGLHRNEIERSARKQIQETNLGASLEWVGSRLQTGILVHRTQFDGTLQRKATIYNPHPFQGTSLQNVSYFANYTLQNFLFFGEAAQSLGHGRAWMVGLMGSVSKEVDISLLLRNFDRDFYTFYGNGFSENTTTQNEQGAFWGVRYQPTKKTLLSGYIDLFRFPWLRFRSYSPSIGNEWLIKYQHKYSKTIQLTIQAREEAKARNITTDKNLYDVQNGIKRNAFISLHYSFGKLEFQSRVQWSHYRMIKASSGMALIQDASIDFGKITLTGRYALFDTDDFDNRQYVSEKDVWLAYSLTNYSGRGIRCFLLTRVQVSKKLDIWIKWSRTTYQNVEQIGSGGEMIAGNSKNDLKFQVRKRF
jgi:hypothetical protein